MSAQVSEETKQASEPIYHATRASLKLFEEVLIHLARHDKICDSVEELKSRFRRWAAYVGALAVPRASLDCRLLGHGNLKEMVLDLVYMLQRNLQWAKVQNQRQRTITYPETTDDSTTSNDMLGLPAVESAISRLFVLSVAIRRSARQGHRKRAGDTDRDSIALCSLLLQKKYPHACKSLRNQLANSIHTRTMSLVHLQLHNDKLGQQRKDPVASDHHAQGRLRGSRPLDDVLTTDLDVPLSPGSQDTRPSTVSPSAVERNYRAKQRPSSSIVSHGSMIWDNKDADLPYPALPKRSAETAFVYCSICSDPLRASTLTEDKWRAHVDGDLEPYICLSELCREPVLYFAKRGDWEDHMNLRHSKDWAQHIHTERWFCDLNHANDHEPDGAEFDEKEKLVDHLKLKHQLTASQVQGRSRRNRRIAEREPFACPICHTVPIGIVDRIQEKPYKLLSAHIVGHLKALAFFSISYLDTTIDHGGSEATTSVELDDDDDDDDPEKHMRIKQYQAAALDDIPVTKKFKDGRCRVDDTIFLDVLLLKEPIDWAYVGMNSMNSITTNLDILERFTFTAEGRFEPKTPRDESLADRIRRSLAKSSFNSRPRDFLPESSIPLVITRFAVAEELWKGFRLRNSGPDLGELINWVLDRASRLFATFLLCALGSPELLAMVHVTNENGIDDASLPLDEPATHALFVSGTNHLRLHHEDNATELLTDFNVDQFQQGQWRFLAPVFTPDLFDYDLKPSCPLPFDVISKHQGSLSSLYRVKLHAGHNDHFNLPEVAIKEILVELGQHQSETDKAWELEARALAAINRAHDSHILRCIAAIRRGKARYFMFPWADGNSLRDFWKKSPGHTLTKEAVVQAIRDIRDVAGALRTLHNLGEYSSKISQPVQETPKIDEELQNIPVIRIEDVDGDAENELERDEEVPSRSIRHGNLKPENLLRFTDPTTGLMVLKVADMGLAKQHVVATQERRQQTKVETAHLTRYEAPETMMALHVRSRLYDMWSLGCITFEYIIWLLYGNEELERFYQSLDSGNHIGGQYFQVENNSSISLRQVVVAWMDHIETHDIECQHDSAIKDFLRIVREKLLVVQLPHNRIPVISPGLAIGMADPIHTAMHRASANECCDALDSILSKVNQGSYGISDQPRIAADPPSYLLNYNIVMNTLSDTVPGSWIWSEPHQHYYRVSLDENGNYCFTWAAAMGNAGPSTSATSSTAQVGRSLPSRSSADDMGMAPPASHEMKELINFKDTPERGRYETLDSRYRVRTRSEEFSFFQVGRVFAMLWAETAGRDVSRSHNPAVTPGRFGESVFTQIRRVVVLRVHSKKRFVEACPISTYGGRGVTKPGCDPAEHTIVYLSGTSPTYLDGEYERGLTKEPLAIIATNPDEQVDPASRLQLGKIYHVARNIKVRDIGMIEDTKLLQQYFREVQNTGFED